MNHALRLFLIAGTLVLAMPAQPTAAFQSNIRAAAEHRPRAAHRASSPDRHHQPHGSTSHHHRRHRASAKH